jgi:HNH endonuclease
VSTYYTATVDHVWPKSYGGTRARDNLAACCFACNQMKGSYRPRSIEDARAYITAKRSEFLSYFLQSVEYHEIEIPHARVSELESKEDLLHALGTFRGQAREIMQRLDVFTDLADTVLARSEIPQSSPLDSEPTEAEIFPDVVRDQ